MEIIIPNKKAFIQKGNRFGHAPVGYDHFGPRVKDDKFRNRQQKISVFKDCENLRTAWNWKLSGNYSDAQILNKLKTNRITLLPMFKMQWSKY